MTTTAAGLPVRPPLTVARADVRNIMERYGQHPGVWAVELALTDGEITRMVVHWTTGCRTRFTVTGGDVLAP